MSKPFVDLELEDRVLRCLLYNAEKDNKQDIDEINSNIGYVVNFSLNSDIFYSAFKKWLYEKIKTNYVKYSECLEKKILLENIKQKYKNKDEYENKEILIDKILCRTFEQKAFKTILNKLKELYNCRIIFDLNIDINESLKNIYEDTSNIESGKLIQKISDTVVKVSSSSNNFRMIEENIFHDIERDIQLIKDKRINPLKYKGIPSGYNVIDKATGGWFPGELTIVLGRPGMGKSVLLLNFASNAYDRNHNVIIVTIEMPLDQQRNRYYCYLTGINYNKLKLPEFLEDSEVEYLENKIRKEKDSHKSFLYYIDAPQNCNASFLESRITAFENAVNEKVDLLIIDPLYLMVPNDREIEDKIGAITWDLKLLSRKISCPVITASQFNRESHNRHKHGKSVDTADAAFTDKIAYNADNIIGITGDKQRAKLEFPKTRDSDVREAFFIKQFERMRFEEDKEMHEDE